MTTTATAPKLPASNRLLSIWLLPIAALLIIGCSLIWFAYDEYNQTIEHEFRALESNDRIAEAQVSGLLRNLEQLLTHIANEQKQLTAAQRPGYDAVLTEQMERFPEIRSLVVINAKGVVEFTGTPKLKSFDSSQRDYFLAHVGKPMAHNFYASRPFKTATGNDMGIAFSVAFRDSAGKLLGVVVSGVDPRFFESVLTQVKPEGEGTIASLFNQHGDLVYRVPDPEKYRAINISSSQITREHLASTLPMTRHIGVSVADGKKRIYAISRLGASGLSVGVGSSYDQVIAEWKRNLYLRGLIFTFAAIIALSLTWIAQRRQREWALAEQEVRREKHFSDEIIDSLPGIFYLLDTNGRFVRWNKRFETILGYSHDEMTQRPALDLIGPNDRERVEERIRQVFHGGESSLEATVLNRYGKETPYHFTGRRTTLDGKHFLVGLGEDIAERKKAEEELQLAASIFKASSEGMLISDAQNNIIAINPAFTEITGYTLADVLGKNPRIFKSGRHDDSFYRELWSTLRSTGQWRGEIWDRNKDGSVTAKRLAINALYGADGNVQRYIALSSDITEKKNAEETIWRQANFDTLTGLPNRRLFLDRLAQEMKKAQRSEETLALLFIDLDRFKEVNDTRGHELGDRLLSEAARRITACVRESDTVARLGGDEFTVVLPSLADTLRVDRVTQAINQALREPFVLNGEDAFISASIGITLYPHDASDMETLLKNADQAMYEAKNKGRDSYSYFVAALQEIALSRQHLIRDLRGALAAGQMAVHFQPIVELATGGIFKAEALVRWRHPERGMVSPVEFIPLAEETGLIHDIGDWVFREAARVAKRWQEAQRGRKTVQISVNKSPRQFASGKADKGWITHLDEIGLPASCMVLEITEGLLLDNRPEITDKLMRFRDCGIQISLDDFGTGYSAMAYLKKFPINYLKIDKSFVRDMATDPGDQAIVEAIIVMAHKLGLKVVAEGVETPEQHARLLEAGCDFGQGYLFAKPLPEAEFEALLRASSFMTHIAI